MFPETEELVVNTDSPLIVKLQALESLGSSRRFATDLHSIFMIRRSLLTVHLTVTVSSVF